MANFRMDERIEFVTVRTFENDEGVKTQNIEVVYTCWANRKNLSNDEFLKSYAAFNKYLISFRTRCCKFTKALEFKTKDYKVRYKGQLFNIVSAMDYQNGHKYVDVKCEVIS